MKFNDKFYKYLFEANNMVLFSYLSLEDKIECFKDLLQKYEL